MKLFYATASLMMCLTSAASANNTHMDDFVSLFDRYCYSFKETPNLTESYLAEMGHEINPVYDAYEILIDGVDYAVTPQPSDCTTDVLLKYNQGTLFSLEQIENTLTKSFGLTAVDSRSFQDVALNNQNTVIQQRDYRDEAGHEYRLLYPSDNQDSYYMTFTIKWLDT